MTDPRIECLRGTLIVSCQAPTGAPLDDPYIISAMALTAEENGAAGVRINSPSHIAATKLRVRVPVIGIEKVVTDESDVYITPTFAVACGIAAAGADIIALDATRRRRPGGETIEVLIPKIRDGLQRPVMADIATEEEGLYAADCGATILATTLCGYTPETRGRDLPALDLLESLARQTSLPVICEGGVGTPDDLRRAFDCGAFAVVVGTAITGIGPLTRAFLPKRS